jgi:hypothetical protein
MPSVILDSKASLQVRREVLTTFRIQNPNFPRSEAFTKLIGDAISTFLRAGVSECELTRMTFVIAQKFITEQTVRMSEEDCQKDSLR